MAMIEAVQIQTVDACNARCIMCPCKSVDHTAAIMDEALFTRILDQLAQGVTDQRIKPNLEVNLFFENEPLLDPHLFDRADQVRRTLPDARIVCFTNGLRLPRLKERLAASAFNLVHVSHYGYDASSFNKVTQLDVDQERFEAIIEAGRWLRRQRGPRVHTDQAWIGKGERWVLSPYTSRGGFYTKEAIHPAVAGCLWDRAEQWLHIHVNGDLVLCCMDWSRETLFGNIADDSLRRLLDSPARQALLRAVAGETSSAADFICKRCEKARRPAPEAALQTVLFTAGNDTLGAMLVEWLTSLRTFGRYRGEVLILDYGLSAVVRDFLQTCGAVVVACQLPEGVKEEAIVNYRFLDAAPVLRERYAGYQIAHFDCDIWFQDDIQPLFRELEILPGCLFATEPGQRITTRIKGPTDRELRARCDARVDTVIERLGGHINGGFMAGRYEPFMDRLDALLRAYREGWSPRAWGVDQYLQNLLFDLDADRGDGQRWNCIPHLALEGQDGALYHNHLSEAARRRNPWDPDHLVGDKIVGLHLIGKIKNFYRFLAYHEPTLQRFIETTYRDRPDGDRRARELLAYVRRPIPGPATLDQSGHVRAVALPPTPVNPAAANRERALYASASRGTPSPATRGAQTGGKSATFHYLRELRGKHPGKRGVILGKGPSVCVWLLRSACGDERDQTVLMALDETVALPGLVPDYWLWPDVWSAEHVLQFGVPRPGTAQVFEEQLTREEPDRIARLAALSESYVYLRGDDAPEDPYAVPGRSSTGSAALVCCRLAGIQDVQMVGFESYDDDSERRAPVCLRDLLMLKERPTLSNKSKNTLLDLALEGSGIQVTWYHRQLKAQDYAEAAKRYGGEREDGEVR